MSYVPKSLMLEIEAHPSTLFCLRSSRIPQKRILLLLFAIWIGGGLWLPCWGQAEEEFVGETFEEEFFEEDIGIEEAAFGTEVEDIARETVFVIPSAPSFSLLGVTPEQVMRPGSIRDFKVDWRIKNYDLAPDLALEVQPIWLLAFHGKPIERYQQAPTWVQRLTSLSLSGATARIDGINHMAYSVKLNLYSQYDALADPELIQALKAETQDQLDTLASRVISLRSKLDTLQVAELRRDWKDSLQAMRYEMKLIHLDHNQLLQAARADYLARRWNSSAVDIAAGRIYTYDNTRLDSLSLRNAGWGLWLNAAAGISRHSLVSGIARLTHTNQQFDTFLGASYRYGSGRFNFFVECTWGDRLIDPNQGFEGEIGTAFVPLEQGQHVRFWQIAYGGDFKLSQGILLNFGIRTRFDQQWQFQKLLPSANLICLMR